VVENLIEVRYVILGCVISLQLSPAKNSQEFFHHQSKKIDIGLTIHHLLFLVFLVCNYVQ